MNKTAPVKLIKILSWLCAAIIFLIPFHAFLTIWLSSAAGHYTLIRLWKEFLLVGLVIGCIYLLAVDKSLRHKLLNFWPARLIAVYMAVFVVWAIVPLYNHAVTGKAMWYGLLVNLRFLVFFLITYIVASKSDWLKNMWPKLVFWPAGVVIIFAVLQYKILPYDFLKHFGYGPNTISPYETINHNLSHIRVESTLRGANPLGAYLVLPLTAGLTWAVRDKSRRLSWAIFGLLAALALTFTFSRSAWIGAIFSLLIGLWLSLNSTSSKRLLSIGLAALTVIAVVLAISLRNNVEFENVFLHTQHHSAVATSSNNGHASALKNAIHDIAHQPLGAGVGTAGPESVYNKSTRRIAENYILQIGQETGVIGMALFIAVCATVGHQLWQRKSDQMAVWLFASLIGISFINLLSHAWTDDSLAYVWWGLAGIACASVIITNKQKQKNGKKIYKT